MPHLLDSERTNSKMLKGLSLRRDDVQIYAKMFGNGNISTATEELIKALSAMDEPSQLGHEIRQVMHEQGITRRQAALSVFTSQFGTPIQNK